MEILEDTPDLAQVTRIYVTESKNPAGKCHLCSSHLMQFSMKESLIRNFTASDVEYEGWMAAAIIKEECSHWVKTYGGRCYSAMCLTYSC